MDTTQSPNSLVKRIIHAALIVFVILPFGTSIVEGCGDDTNDYETVCIDWPDPNRTDINPNVCPADEDAQAYYFPDKTLVGGTPLENGQCCYKIYHTVNGCSGGLGSFGATENQTDEP